MTLQKIRDIINLEYKKNRHIINSESAREPYPAAWTTKIQHCLPPNIIFYLKVGRKSPKFENFDFLYMFPIFPLTPIPEKGGLL